MSVRIGNGKSRLRCLLGEFVYLNANRGITVAEAFIGTRCKGLKWEKRHVQAGLFNMANAGQIASRWVDGKKRFFPNAP